jgi:imidazolonepropionase-like amidohydrolase
MKPTLFCKFISILLFSFFSLPTIASPIYLQAKDYLDVKTGQFIQPGNILIDNGKIVAINPAKVPADATIIKKPGLTLLPGLMNMHVHLTGEFSNKFALDLVQNDDAMCTVHGVKNAEILLMSGFTTVRNLGGYPGESFVDVALSKASELGWIKAPHIIPAGHALSITGGHMDPDMFGDYAPNVLPVNYRIGVADGVDEVVKSVRYQIKHGAKVIKIAATAGVISTEDSVGAQQYSDEEMRAIVNEANKHDVPVAAHAHGTEGINAAIKAGVRSIEHGSLMSDEGIRLMKEHGTYLVPTAYIHDGLQHEYSNKSRKKAEYLQPLSQQSLHNAIKAGVKIAFGTDSGAIPHTDNAKEFAVLVKRGMLPIDAIRAATINSAEMMKISDRGEIKVGYHADMIGITDNPLTNIKILENVRFVMKDGEVVKDK